MPKTPYEQSTLEDYEDYVKFVSKRNSSPLPIDDWYEKIFLPDRESADAYYFGEG
jgi:hypothetical protein